MNKKDLYLVVYSDRSELHSDDSKIVFLEGRQNEETQQRFQKISLAFENGFLNDALTNLQDIISFGNIDNSHRTIIHSLVEGITSEVGRALVGLTCLQLAIKSIDPQQSIRLHKGGRSDSSFS